MAKLLEGLSGQEKIVAQTAYRLRKILRKGGACYQIAFFLKYYLENVHGISGVAVVGYTNDGTDLLYSSHAWYELNGVMTDIAISKPLHPQMQKAGPLVIHGHVIQRGWDWTYHRTMPAEGVEEFDRALRDPAAGGRFRELADGHIRMTRIAQDNAQIRTYLDTECNVSYEALASAVRC